VSQVTFSGNVAADARKEVLYVTERCVFRLTPEGLALTEVRPGIDLERDILAQLPFKPLVLGPASMDAAIFRPEPMGLRARMLDIRIEERLSYDAPTNTVFMNYAGMRVRNSDDVGTIIAAVDRLIGPLAKRVNCIVNYEGFSVDDDAMPAYMDAVRYVEQKYYLKVSRFTNSGYLRMKFAKELDGRALTSKVFETRREAERNLTQVEEP
jgi:propionate CoA-transferase